MVMFILRVIRSGNGGKRRGSSSRLLHTEKFLESQLKRLKRIVFRGMLLRKRICSDVDLQKTTWPTVVMTSWARPPPHSST